MKNSETQRDIVQLLGETFSSFIGRIREDEKLRNYLKEEGVAVDRIIAAACGEDGTSFNFMEEFHKAVGCMTNLLEQDKTPEKTTSEMLIENAVIYVQDKAKDIEQISSTHGLLKLYDKLVQSFNLHLSKFTNLHYQKIVTRGDDDKDCDDSLDNQLPELIMELLTSMVKGINEEEEVSPIQYAATLESFSPRKKDIKKLYRKLNKKSRKELKRLEKRLNKKINKKIRNLYGDIVTNYFNDEELFKLMKRYTSALYGANDGNIRVPHIESVFEEALNMEDEEGDNDE